MGLYPSAGRQTVFIIETMSNKALVVIDIQNNMRKAGYTVHVLSDYITSYDLKKLPEMLSYYAKQGCEVMNL